jgi:cyclase
VRSVRLIPVLLIHRNGIYKSINFSNYKYIGDPINAIRLFNDLEVDEICILDIDVSKNNGCPNYELIEDIASEAFMPFSYGGGIKTVDQAKKIFNLGIEN